MASRTSVIMQTAAGIMFATCSTWQPIAWMPLQEVLEDWKSGGIFAFSPYQSSSGGTGDFLIAIDSSALRSLTTDTLNQRASDVWSAGLEAEGNNSNSSHSLNTSWTGGRAGSSDVRLAAMARRAVEVITASTVELLALSLQAEAVHASLRGQALDQLNAQVAEAAMSHGLLPDLSVHSTTNSSGGGGGGISLGSGLRYSPWVVSAQRMEVELQHAWPRGFGALPAGGAVQMLEGDMTGLLQVRWNLRSLYKLAVNWVHTCVGVHMVYTWVSLGQDWVGLVSMQARLML